MTESQDLDAPAVAAFLQARPDFFQTHADVFATLEIPSPHGTRAISLGERQILTLRERNREIEWRLAELIRNASANELIGQHITQWSARLLGESVPHRIPAEIALGLAEQFKLSDVALRVWDLPGAAGCGFTDGVSEDVRTFAASLKKPYCGNDTGFEAAGWLREPPKSLAIVALRTTADAPTIGLLVLASDDVQRFHNEMGTAFLDVIAQLAAAALQRLNAPAAAEFGIDGVAANGAAAPLPPA